MVLVIFSFPLHPVYIQMSGYIYFHYFLKLQFCFEIKHYCIFLLHASELLYIPSPSVTSLPIFLFRVSSFISFTVEG